MPDTEYRGADQGRNQSALRDHNERLILTTLLRNGGLSGSEIARMSGLSPQTISVIMRELERDELVIRGQPQRGKVGKPSVPMELNPDGAFSIGLKIGRRSTDVLLTNMTGKVIADNRLTYAYPTTDAILDFLQENLESFKLNMPERDFNRIAGIGVALPFQIWRWAKQLGAPEEAMRDWEDLNFAARIMAFSTLPVFVENDATAAGRAEHFYGFGRMLRNYGYFFVGYFIGGAIVLNQSVFDGPTGNAAAFGSLPVRDDAGNDRQLIEMASLCVLEEAVKKAGLDTAQIWDQPQDWSKIKTQADAWIEQTAQHLVRASLTICAVIDFEAIVIDGWLPTTVRSALAKRTAQIMKDLDHRGIKAPEVIPGSIGMNARARGAAATPILTQFFMNAHGSSGL